MAKFLNREELYRLLQRELPEESVYPDGAASAFYSTADMDSIADCAATAYGTLQRIYDNYFPQTADEQIQDWINKMFIGFSFDNTVTLQELRDRVIAKVRKQPRITLWEVLTLVAGYVPEGNYVEILEYCSASGSWLLGESQLGLNTILGSYNTWGKLGATGDFCSVVADRGWTLGVSQLGLDTELDQYGYLPVAEAQLYAYGYEIRIYNTAVTGTSYDQMVKQVSETEPARSVHRIIQNLDINTRGLNTIVPNVDQEDLITCITRDSTSDTGYTGRTV